MRQLFWLKICLGTKFLGSDLHQFPLVLQISAMFCAKAKVKPGGMMTCAQLRRWLCCSSGGPQIMEPKVPSSSHHCHHHHPPHSALTQPPVALAFKKFTGSQDRHWLQPQRSLLSAEHTCAWQDRRWKHLAGRRLPGECLTQGWHRHTRHTGHGTLATRHTERNTNQAHSRGTLPNQTQHQNAASTQTIFTLRNCKIRSQ